MTTIWAIFVDDLTFTKNGKIHDFLEKFSAKLEQKNVGQNSTKIVEKTRFFSR